jgi:hypothetical protein
VPGVSPSLSRRGYQRALAAGAHGDYVSVRGGVHGVALRSPRGLVPLPRARAYEAAVLSELRRFSGATT